MRIQKKLSVKAIETLCIWFVIVIFAANVISVVPLLAHADELADAVSNADCLPEGEKQPEEEPPPEIFDTTPIGEGLAQRSIRIYPNGKGDGKTVTLDGVMPEGASVTAVDVTEVYDIGTLADMEEERQSAQHSESSVLNDENVATDEAATLAAYNITITDDAGEEFQPSQSHPILVEVVDPGITTDGYIELWHVSDDGVREQITNFYTENGRLSFYATGFSVYAIVTDAITLPSDAGSGWSKVESDAQLAELSDAGQGMFIGQISGYFFKDSVITYSSSGVPGIAKTSQVTNCPDDFYNTEPVSGAGKFYFEKVENADGQYYIYCKNNDNEKQYIYYYYHSGKSARWTIGLTNDETNKAVFSVKKRAFTDSSNGSAYNAFVFYCIPPSETKTYYFNMHKDAGGNNFSLWTADNNSSQFDIWYKIEEFTVADDPYHFNGKFYGLMNFSGADQGRALIVEDENRSNAMQLTHLIIRNENADNKVRTVYVAENDTITIWQFRSTGEDHYLVFSNTETDEIYLKVQEDGTVTHTNQPDEATEFKLTPDKNGRIMLTSIANGLTVCFDQNAGCFKAQSDPAGESPWLSLVKYSSIRDDDEMTYTATKVSVSAVPDGHRVILYTRVWDEANKTYLFYAVDHEGKLEPCFECGNNIMWVDDRANTLLWDFTEYKNSAGTAPSYYYELHNRYSGKYLAPQLHNNQIVADSKIGINMPGRKENEYHTEILAWDAQSYAYTGLRVDPQTKTLVPCVRSKADTFYFATVDSLEHQLTKVDTIDNEKFGVTMKMIDYKSVPVGTNSGLSYNQGLVLDNNETGSNGSNATSGLLSTNLKDNGYPTTKTGQSLAALYKNADGTIIQNPWREVNHLFVKSIYDASGYFEYDSCQNFATLIKEDGSVGTNFNVYKEIGSFDKTASKTHMHGQFMPYNTIRAGHYCTTYTPQNMNAITGEPLPESDPRKYEKLFKIDNPDYHVGMEMEASFVQTPNGLDSWGHDIIFEFTGDDDFWLYVDGELIIDLGGIHSALGGSVNFCTGDVMVNGNHYTLKGLFASNYRARYQAAHPEADAAAVNVTVDQYIDENFESGKDIFKEYSYHHMRIFYMERGASASNLHMRFNLSYIKPGNVLLSKKVTGNGEIDREHMKFPYQIWYKKNDGSNTEHLLRNDYELIRVTYQNSTKPVEFVESYTPPDCNETYHSVYLVSPQQSAVVAFPDDALSYKIVECGVSKDVYDYVKINGTNAEGTELTGAGGGGSGRHSYDNTNLSGFVGTEWASVKDRPTILFENHLDTEHLQKILFTKELYKISLVDNEEISVPDYNDNTTFSFRLYLSNGADVCYTDANGNTLNLTDMYEYRVKDPAGNYCYWNTANQTFSSLGTNDFSTLSKTQKESATFETSINGAISNIPAWYTVEVPDITAGTMFKVEERENEIPIGYEFAKYECVDDSYSHAPDTVNIGKVYSEKPAHLKIINHRGWGLSAQKVWTDERGMSNYDPIYVAVYRGNDLIEDTVRQIQYPRTEARYYFSNHFFQEKHYAFNDLEIREVQLTGTPTVDTEGKVTNYASITPIANGTKVNVRGLPEGSSEWQTNEYTVSYKKGELEGKALNARVDTVTNTRPGGVKITLYDMKTNEPLRYGEFRLAQGETFLGTYTSDATGTVTVTYCLPNKTYTLSQIAAPQGYLGMPMSVTFKVARDGTVTNLDGSGQAIGTAVSDAQSGGTHNWEEGYRSTADDIDAQIDIYNKELIIEAYKYNGTSSKPIPNVAFELRDAVSGIAGETMSNVARQTGLKSGSDGYVRGITTNLMTGTYYLKEITPDGYYDLNGDIKFHIDNEGVLTYTGNATDENGHRVSMTSSQDGGQSRYIITIPNTKIGNSAPLKVTKEVTGVFGSKHKQFTFTLTTDDPVKEYSWSKNGEDMSGFLKSGDTFTLADGENVVINLPLTTNVTITEDNSGYQTSFQLDEETAVNANTKTFTITDDAFLQVTNERNGLVPTGVNLCLNAAGTVFLGSLAGFVLLTRQRLKRKGIQVEELFSFRALLQCFRTLAERPTPSPEQ